MVVVTVVLVVLVVATNVLVVLVQQVKVTVAVMVGVSVGNLGVQAVAAVLRAEVALVTLAVAVTAVLVGHHQYREVP